MFVEQKILARKSKQAEPRPTIRPMPSNRFLTKITVLNPTLVKFGWFNSFYTYQITSVIDSISFQVTRRFSDVDWVFKVLQENYKGYIIPLLPEKKLINNTDPLFIEQRRVDIETFLNSIKDHEVLGSSSEFLGFLKVSDEKFQNFKESEQARSDLFEVKSLRDTLDQTLATIETKFQNFSETGNGSEFETIRSQAEEKKNSLKILLQSFDLARQATCENDSKFLKVFQGLGLETERIDMILQKGRKCSQETFEGLSGQQETFSALFNTFEVFLASVEKKKTVKNLMKRRMSGEFEKEGDAISGLEMECEKVLMNIKKEYSTVERNFALRAPTIFQSYCRGQVERFFQLRNVLKDF
jgi:hypothetical protein